MIPHADAPVLEWARWYLGHGLSVIPIKNDGSKSPSFSGWRKFTAVLPADEDLLTWFDRPGFHGIGVVPGPASGNLAVLDFECRAGRPAYAEWLPRLSPAATVALAECPVVRTPSGGRHVWVRLPDAVGGTILGRYTSGTTKAEVRGDGQQVLAPGCPPACHKSGDRYVFEQMGWLA